MKKLLLPIMMILFLSSCTNEAIIDQPEELSSTSLKGGKADIVLSPSGDITGVTDADAIESALAALPSGGVLLLESGTFYINRTIVAPDGFNGAIKGRKMDLTEVIGVGDVATPFSVFDGSYSTLFFPNPQGSVSVSDLTISLPDGFTAEGWPGPGFEFDLTMQFIGSFINVNLGESVTDTNFEKLRLIGGSSNAFFGTVLPFSPFLGILVSRGDYNIFDLPFSSDGLHVINKCEISRIGVFPTFHQKMKNSTIKISNNTFFEIAQVHTQWLDGCNVFIQKNNIDANSIGSIVVTQEGQPVEGATNYVNITGNKVSTNGLYPIEIGPITGNAGFNLMIKDNELTSLGPDPYIGAPQIAGIAIFPGNDNAVVKDNKISGIANYGIWQESNNGSFKENDLTDFSANLFDYLLLGDNNEIKGIGASTVDDQGINNIIKN